MDEKMLQETFNKFEKIITVCEGSLNGGFGEGVQSWAAENDFSNRYIISLGIPDKFIEHGNRDLLLQEIGLDPEGIAMSALELHQKIKARSGSRKTN